MTPHIGAEVKIRPSGLVLDHERRIAHLPGRPMYLTGVIEYINHDHRFFRVAYQMNNYTLHECFKF